MKRASPSAPSTRNSCPRHSIGGCWWVVVKLLDAICVKWRASSAHTKCRQFLQQRVWEASERGADQAQIRTIVDRFVADLTQRGQLPTVPPAAGGAPPSAEDEERPAPRARRTFPTLLQYPEDIRYPVEVSLPWYAGDTTVEWPDQRVIARKIGKGYGIRQDYRLISVPEVRQSSFVPLPPAQPVRWMHSGSQHVP